MVDSILTMKEYNRYMKGMFDYVSYNTKWIAYDAPNRKVGISKFNLRTLFKYAIEGITSTSTAPLLLSIYVGLFFCLMSFVIIFYILIKTLIYGNSISMFYALVCVMLFICGIQLFFLGVIGTYISKIFLEVKNRPIYVIKEKK